jgi:hypothetical protein
LQGVSSASKPQQSEAAWGLGDVFTTGDGRKLRIVDLLQLPEQEAVDLRRGGVWVVEPAD